jgi:cytidine deaminase
MNNQIIEIAIKMRQNSYAPYSKYKVGSAVEVISGEIIGGCNVESSSYGLTCCAERIAIYSALSRGFKDFKSIAVSTKKWRVTMWSMQTSDLGNLWRYYYLHL